MPRSLEKQTPMLTSSQARQVANAIARLTRREVIDGLRRCPARFPLDFTNQWLDSQPLSELRHIYAALCVQCGHIPPDTGGDPTTRAA